jgi:CBS domain-containing protein
VAQTARDVMTADCECIGANETVSDAARKLKDLGVGSMPICGEDDKLKGMLTDRDIVVKVVAEGRDPAATTAGELGDGAPVTVGADDPIDSAISAMAEHQVRRLPVLDESKRLVGIVSQADLARQVDEQQVGKMVGSISN